MAGGVVHVEERDGTLWLRIARPSFQNAVDLSMMAGLREVIEKAVESETQVMVITGEGEDFCIGRDHHESPLADGSSTDPDLWVRSAGGVFEALSAFEGISVASVRGRAYGFGCALAVTTDVCVASADARFALDEVAKGFAPRLVIGGLVGRIPTKAIAYLVLTGRPVSADHALAMGVASLITETPHLENETERLVEGLAAADRAALLSSKRLINERAASDPSVLAAQSLTSYALL